MAGKQSQQKTEETALVPSAFGGLGAIDEKALVSLAESSSDERGTADADSIRDGMGNVRPKLGTVKVMHHGACQFLMPDEKKADRLLGVVIAHTRSNAWFAQDISTHADGALPECFSSDGLRPSNGAAEPQAGSCLACPRNRDATDKVAREAAFQGARDDQNHACRNYLVLAVSLPGEEIPVLLRLSNTSFRPWAQYVQDIGTKGGRFRPSEVVTEITLRNQRTKVNTDISVAQFRLVGPLPADARAVLAPQADTYLSVIRRDDMQTSEEPVEVATPKPGADDEVPF